LFARFSLLPSLIFAPAVAPWPPLPPSSRHAPSPPGSGVGRASYGREPRQRASPLPLHGGDCRRPAEPATVVIPGRRGEGRGGALQKHRCSSGLQICGCLSWTTCTQLPSRSCSHEQMSCPSLDGHRQPRFLSHCYCLTLAILYVALQFWCSFLCYLVPLFNFDCVF
jgi:hypothetical protein